jgi:D-serine deaminase-like pyridoxal phosphate-dependent protein
VNGPLRTLDAATRHLPAPLAVVDLEAFDANAADLARRAGGVPLRLATKSVRVRQLIERALAGPQDASGPAGSVGSAGSTGFASLMTFSLREALWLARAYPTADILVGYPTVDGAALAELAAEPAFLPRVTVMVDDAQHLARAAAAARDAGNGPVRLCLDVDSSLRAGVGRFRTHLGVRRSPLHEPAEVAALARRAEDSGDVEVVGVMFYEAQIAGLPDRSHAVRAMKRLSARELLTRRTRVVHAVQDELGRKLEIVNGGGTGSLEVTGADAVVTELTAGSGLYCPTLFDRYDAFTSRPSAYFGLDVVRTPAHRIVTAFGGGYIASGPAGDERVPLPVFPPGLRLVKTEGAGEVQTPLRIGRGAVRPSIGDRVWLRHAKAGELMEHFTNVQLVRDGHVVDSVATYRGEGRCFA